MKEKAKPKTFFIEFLNLDEDSRLWEDEEFREQWIEGDEEYENEEKFLESISDMLYAYASQIAELKGGQIVKSFGFYDFRPTASGTKYAYTNIYPEEEKDKKCKELKEVLEKFLKATSSEEINKDFERLETSNFEAVLPENGIVIKRYCGQGYCFYQYKGAREKGS